VLAGVADKVQVIPIGLDKDAYPTPAPERLHAWRQRLGERFFLFVGVLRYYKGLHILLQAAQGQGWPIVIAGAGPIEAELKAQAAALGLQQVHFLGFVPEEDKAALLQLCHAVVFPSHLRSEAFGVSLLEGAMFGKALISCEIGTGTSYINIGGETGLVVPPADPAALREAMQFLWNHPEQAAAMGQRARQRFEHHFTAAQMVDAYAALYARLANLAA
jgi:rhamnosyl/mannosyltransferase